MRKSIVIITLILNSLSSYSQNSSNNGVKFERIKIESRENGLKLSLLHLSPQIDKGKRPPVLFIHGSTFPSSLAFGFRMNNYSWMDDLALAGFDVFALDFLGYGDSDNYPGIINPNDEKELLGRGEDVVEDVNRAVEFILERTTSNKLFLIGHSWGGTVAGHYATIESAKIEKLVLFAPITQRDGPTEWEVETNTFKDLTPDERIEQFLNAIPTGEETTLEEDVLTKWGNEWLNSDVSSINRQPASVRFPVGWEKDLYDCWNGACFFDPSKLNVPTLIVRGEWDNVFNSEDADGLLRQINTPLKRLLVIGKSTHVIHLEKPRFQLYDEVRLFINENINKKEKMIAVIFEVIPHKEFKNEYLEIATELKSELAKIPGFISIERFVSIQHTEKILSLSYWENEQAVREWRNLEIHRNAQMKGRDYIFEDYTLRVATVIRDYGMTSRDEAPMDSQQIHD